MNAPQTRAHRRYAQAVGVLLAAGLMWGGHALATARLEGAMTTVQAWRDGSAGRALDRSLRIPGLTRVDAWLAAARYRLFGDLGPQVVEGCKGWLFYRDGMRAPGAAHEEAAFVQRLRLMRAWAAGLRDRKVDLLVVVVPDKSRIQEAQLCGQAYSKPMRQRLDRWNAEMEGRGIAYVDLRQPLTHVHTAFFRTDVHMNARGAAAAAQAVAGHALSLLGSTGPLRYDVQRDDLPTARTGDLLVLSGLKDAPTGWRPKVDLERVQTMQPVRTGGLLDDTPPVEVMLVGSSNGRRSLFAERLSGHLGREVWNRSMDGGQFAGALMAALEQPSAWPASLKLVIWEFSEMSLSLPLNAAELNALAQLDRDHAL
ncbi:MAG: cell division protein FtsQ, partial [Burkholderiaceae bacterium]